MDETQEIRQARYRASVKWLLSKAYNNRVPDNLKEPFYRDHENQERLKPKIVVDLGNATLYCQTLSNLYSDPNYQSLNHWSILQTLARKGVPVNEKPDMPLTETVLIQTNPLRIVGHMAVIEALMMLYAKEITSNERIINAIKRISGNNEQLLAATSGNIEKTVLYWVSHTCSALKKRIERDLQLNPEDENGKRFQAPDIPPVRDFQDLCDGICLALLISYYCPKIVRWTDVRINYLPAVEDSIHNILLVSNFSQKYLPYNVFHMLPEDVTYMRGSMRLNLLVLLADLFNLFEIHPSNCVTYPGMDPLEIIAKQNAGANEHGIYHRRGLTMPTVTPIPDLRSELDQPSTSPSIRPQFQVTYTNLPSGLISKPPPSLQPLQSQFDQNQMAENVHFENEAFVVHKSRGITTLSSMHMHQQDPLIPARLRQAKEKNNTESKADERGDNVPAGRPSNWDQHRRPSFAGRRSRRNSSSEDSQLTIENFGGSQDQLNNIDRFERERERKLSNSTIEHVVPVRSSVADARGTLQIGYDTDSGSEKQDRDTEKQEPLKRQPSCDNVNLISSAQSKSNNTMYTQQKHSTSPEMVTEDSPRDPNATLTRKSSNASVHMKTTNWQNNQSDTFDDDTRSLESTCKLSNIRMKLEEKRKKIEQDKQRIEMALMRYQEKLNQDDYMEADYMKWETMSNDSKRTSDIDPNELDKYQQSIAIMNMNLQDIQQDIQRLATQQNQIQAQQMQAQQLLQAQQIANMLNQQQQNFGSQQHLADLYPTRPLQHQQSFGSSPHLPQSFNVGVGNPYGSRPPSRDPYQQMQPMPVQYINDNTTYVYPQQQQQQSMLPQPPYNTMHPHYNDNNVVPYSRSNNHSFSVAQSNSQLPMQSHHSHQQYIPRQSIYDDYPMQSMHGLEPNMSPQPNNYYGHEPLAQQQQHSQYPTQRRTWAQPSFEAMQMVDVGANSWQVQRRSQKSNETDVGSNWGSPQMDNNVQHHRMSIHQNGDGQHHQIYPVHSSPLNTQRMSSGNGGGVAVQRQQSMTNLRETRSPNVFAKTSSAPTPPDDVMAPQSICFIGDQDDIDEIERSVIEKMQSTGISEDTFSMYHHPQQQQLQSSHPSQVSQMHREDRQNNFDEYNCSSANDMIPQKLNITSGNLTYRIPSPQRPQLHPNSFQDPRSSEKNAGEKGFYISFDDDQPKRPKPPLRAKRSPKKEKSLDSVNNQLVNSSDSTDYAHAISNDINIEPKMLSKAHTLNYSDSNGSTSCKNKTTDINKATYNKYTDSPIHLSQVMLMGESKNENKLQNCSPSNNNNQPLTPPPSVASTSPTHLRSNISLESRDIKSKALVIGADPNTLDTESAEEMERRKEKIMLLSLQRRQQQEEAKERKEQEAARKREIEREKEEEKQRKKEEQMARRAAILEQHRLKKALEEAEREGKTLDRSDIGHKSNSHTNTVTRTRPKPTRPRPKTIHVDDGSVDISEASSISSRGKKGSSTNLTGYGQLNTNSMRRDYYRGSQDSLTVKEPNVERGRTLSRISVAKGSTLNFRGRKSNSLMNLCDSGIGRATPPRRAPSPGMATLSRHMPSPSGPGSLPPGLISKRRGIDDGSSDISSTGNSMMDYSGPKLYKQPAAKSNRGIILNAVEYCVFPGAVNRDAKQKVLEKIARSEAKHFLILFRDAGCQFRALYSYIPDTEQVIKLYGTGPSQVDEVMFDKFFKYNSGGKCFSQVHTKHLTVTIDAFTIHNSLWQGKKVNLPSKKDMVLVI